jgi:hypothetical protein
VRKIICKKVYDTNESVIIKKVTYGSWGDADGYEETLYVTADGSYFLYENGGADSIHPKEAIKRMSKKNAEEWLKNN